MRSIAHISDLHFGREVQPVVEGLAADIQGQKPSVVVASGDLTQRARRKQFSRVREFLDRLPKPLMVVPGNHDVPLYDVYRRFWHPLDRYRQYICDELEPFYADEELAIVAINTTRSWTWRLRGFWKDGRIDAEQLEMAERRLGALPGNVFKVVVTHHPFIPPPGEGMDGMVGGAAGALEGLGRCGVELLLAGHLHQGYSGDVRAHYATARRSMLSVQAGTGVSDRRRDKTNAYNLIVIDDAMVAIHVRAWNGREFAEAGVTRYQKQDDAWEMVR